MSLVEFLVSQLEIDNKQLNFKFEQFQEIELSEEPPIAIKSTAFLEHTRVSTSATKKQADSGRNKHQHSNLVNYLERVDSKSRISYVYNILHTTKDELRQKEEEISGSYSDQ